jgi:hypothetical protein
MEITPVCRTLPPDKHREGRKSPRSFGEGLAEVFDVRETFVHAGGDGSLGRPSGSRNAREAKEIVADLRSVALHRADDLPALAMQAASSAASQCAVETKLLNMIAPAVL